MKNVDAYKIFVDTESSKTEILEDVTKFRKINFHLTVGCPFERINDI